MNSTLTTAANTIIDLSVTLDHTLEKWSDQSSRPNELSAAECVGYISKDNEAPGVSIVLDVQAPTDSDHAILRAWAINIHTDENGIDRFDNVQLNFNLDYEAARVVTTKGAGVTREDLQQLLERVDTKPESLTVSDQSGYDEANEQPLGKRYDIDFNESEVSSEAAAALENVLARLNEAA